MTMMMVLLETIPIMDNPATASARFNRVLAMLGQISRATVRAKSPDHLYLDVCRITVNCGLFNHAWIDAVDSVMQRLKTLASWGQSSRFTELVAGEGKLAAQILHNRQAGILTNTAHPGTDQYGAALTANFQAVIGLPLCEGEKVFGILFLYVDQPGFFDQTVIGLLAETAGDISFALEHLENDQRRLAAEAKLYYLAFYDAQTGLPSRAMLEQRLPDLAARARDENKLLTLIDIKLRHVDQILQILGNAGMDEVLRILALRLEQCRTEESFVAQLAPDEFALVVLGLHDNVEVLGLAQQLQHILADTIACGKTEIFIHASIGAAVFPLHEREVKYLLRRARAAAERPHDEIDIRLYTPDLDRGLEQRVEMMTDLHKALERNEFLLYYQPQLNVKTGEIVGLEALLRWQHPKNGIISPVIFIPLLEQTGMMPAVGSWVLRMACQQAKIWQRQGLKPLRIAVNLSAQQFRLTDLVPTVKKALDDADLEAQWLELELTESLILESADRTIQTMRELKQLGLTLSLDDFGTGYSSLSYLRHYPVDRIKIDQSFIRDMTRHAGSAALVRSILAMAGNLDLTAIAEGVETVAQYHYLRQQLCQEMQGFLFSRPIPVAQLTQLLQDGKKFDPSAMASVSS